MGKLSDPSSMDSKALPQRGGSNFLANFNRRLASTEQQERVEAVEELVSFLTQYQDEVCNKENMMLVWKGVFYTFWMSDKPLFQQELADELAGHLLQLPIPLALLHFECFWSTLINEWSGIDIHRLDKFLLLQRRFVNAGLGLLQAHNWDTHVVSEIARVYREGPFHPTSIKVSNAIRYHILDLFLAELKGALPFDGPGYQLHLALRPIIEVFSTSTDKVVRNRAQTKVLEPLMEEMLQSPLQEVFRDSAAALAKEWFQIGASPDASHTKRIYCYKLVSQLTQAYGLQDLDFVSTLKAQRNTPSSEGTSAVPIVTTKSKRVPEAVATEDSPKKVLKVVEEPLVKAPEKIAEETHLELAASAGFKVSDVPAPDMVAPLPKEGEVDSLSNFRVLSLKAAPAPVVADEECVATHEVYVEDIVSHEAALLHKKVRWGLEKNHIQMYEIGSKISSPTKLDSRPVPLNGSLKPLSEPIRLNLRLLQASSLGLPACLANNPPKLRERKPSENRNGKKSKSKARR
ncbi:hypothetical protein DSO57_1008862 [Entomophthora muscae]|uniref:Uncharacterized protein n=1 Tax=Entomophthora muscae TaxID=34485 RepID=A0ACC2RXZ7_9FUNG|nr:hypothetical protein DSO57_1008862 [Entomophthora muscae]